MPGFFPLRSPLVAGLPGVDVRVRDDLEPKVDMENLAAEIQLSA